jgi:integrase
LISADPPHRPLPLLNCTKGQCSCTQVQYRTTHPHVRFDREDHIGNSRAHLRRVVVNWVAYLRQEKLWGLDDPLFPATKIVVGNTRHFEASGLHRKHWRSAGPIRKIFKDAFAAAGLSYFNPHSFRKTLALLGGKVCKTPEEYKAWSQNLGHENVLTTFSSYGDVAGYRQAEIIRGLGEQRPGA